MFEASFTVPGRPVGKGRPRFFRGHAVTPKETREYEDDVKYLCQLENPGVRFVGPVSVRIDAYWPIPKSYQKKRVIRILQGLEKPTVRPDLDNVAKIILDALSGALWGDDAAVVELEIFKLYDQPGAPGKVEVTVTGEPDPERLMYFYRERGVKR